MGTILKGLSLLWSVGSTIWGIVSALFRTKSEADKERDAGAQLGAAKVEAAATQKDLNDAQKAVDASSAAGAADDDGGLRKPHPGDKPWNPDGIG